MYFSTTLILLLVVVNILVYYLQKPSSSSSSLGKRPMHEEDYGQKNDSSSLPFKQRSMASSSSSSNFNSASDSHSWKYEVFISFRGEDTRKGFVDHLYTALVQQGIETYKDDVTLPRGATIGPALIKAIQESRIAVIVFSRNYANSSWCLDELAHIVECRENKGQIVMPVFYDVDPSDVRKQNGSYGEAFAKHECESKHKVEFWREALVKAGNLSGWVPKDFANGHEAVCIKDIVAKISTRFPPLVTDANKDFVGLESRLQYLKSMLEIGSGGVRMVGIWGVGGAGKTTVASAAYNEISHQFEGCCLLENIRDESSKNGLTKLQEKFLSLITKETEVVGSETEGRNMIKRKLGCKSVLVVLDDVNKREQLKALAGAYDWFGEGSRIIITTRDKHLLTLMNATIYEVSLLSAGESLKLFCRHAFQKDEPVEAFKTLSQEVVSYASGLPLALEILGSFLYKKDKDDWRSVLAKLKRIPDPDVTKTLKISYDGLQPDEKQLFLDIACCYRRVEIDEAMPVLDACNIEPRIGIKVLVQKSLIKVSDGRFDMHDLVEEMAHYIVRGEHPGNPEKYSRIWKLEDIKSLCATGEAVLETEVLAIRDNYDALMAFNVDFEENHLRRLPNVIANMKKLRWIDWDHYPPSSFPSNFQPTRLGCLMLQHSRLEQLWEGCKSLPNLKTLDLSRLWDLKSTPDFKGLPCLERLNLAGCRKLEEIHPSIGYHKRLVWVNMEGCSKLEWFPPIIHMIKLETLVLSYCYQLKEFPDIQTSVDRLSLPSLKILDLQHSKLKRTPDFNGLPCLERLNLEYSFYLEEIHPSIGYHKRLVWVSVFSCIELEWFPPIIEMIKLETLVLSKCFQLKTFPEIQMNMDSLINLHMDGTGIELVPPSVGQFCTNLVTFDLEKCAKLKRIEGNFRLLTRLKYLKISGCIQLEKLEGDFFGNECCLEEELPQFPCLSRNLDLSDCKLRDGDMPSDMSGYINLQVLDLSGNKFSRLHSSLFQIPCLKYLNLSGCQNLVELPDLPSSIAILKAVCCYSLQSVGDLSNCKWLWKVSLYQSNRNKMIGGERVVRSMVQINAVEDRFMSILLPHARWLDPSELTITMMTLQLPHNWYNDFSGFLLSAEGYYWRGCSIYIKQAMMLCMDSQPHHHHWEEFFDKKPELFSECGVMGYVPFASLSHTSWWNPAYTHVTFQTKDLSNPRVELIPRKSKSRERAINYSECREEIGYKKTFQIIDDTDSSQIEIEWSPGF